MKKEKIDFLYELIMTFSNRKSLFSSKKIERFIVFWVFLISTVIYLMINMRSLEAWDLVEVTAIWLGFSGYNALLTQRDRKLNNSSSDSGDIVDVPSGDSTSG